MPREFVEAAKKTGDRRHGEVAPTALWTQVNHGQLGLERRRQMFGPGEQMSIFLRISHENAAPADQIGAGRAAPGGSMPIMMMSTPSTMGIVAIEDHDVASTDARL